MTNPVVWYVAYGSNRCAERFAEYLAGCRDGQGAQGDRAVLVPYRLRFAGRSRRWGGGGVAFLDVDPVAPCRAAAGVPAGATDGPPGAPSTPGRAWLLGARQLADVMAQECGLPAGALDLPAGAVEAATPTVLAPDRWYGCLVPLGPGPDGVPQATFTSPVRGWPEDREPSAAYLAVIERGAAQRPGPRGAML